MSVGQADITIEVAAAVIVKHGRLLLVRKRGTSAFILPGGKPESGESDLQCLAREMREELAATIDTDAAFLGAFEAEAANEPGRRVLARAYLLYLLNEPMAAGEIEKVIWCDIRKPREHYVLAPLVLDAILPRLQPRRRREMS